MEIFEGHRALFRPLARPAVALGNFDGVHIGHRALLDRARGAAASVAGDVVVYTFDPHPARVLAPELAPPLLCTLDRKLELLAEAGVGVTVVEPFTRELAALTPSDFHHILAEVLRAHTIVVGYDFTYGRKRSGNVDTLRQFGAESNIAIEVVDAVAEGGLVASSSKIRELISEGNVAGAADLLGRPYDVDGVVVRGAGRGKSIGVPTANLDTSAELLPPNGVYAVRVRLLDSPEGGDRLGAANLGVNPTVATDGRRSLEVHLLEFDGDLYRRRLRVQWVDRLRDEQRFSGIDELVAQIRADIDEARRRLA